MSLLDDGLHELLGQVTDTTRPDERREAVDRYIDELLLWNRRINLVKISPDERPRRAIEKHILDSLAGLPVFRRLGPETVADLGSGGGFPGVPLSLFLPDTSFTLVERVPRKGAFLRNVKALVPLPNVRIAETSLEKMFSLNTSASKLSQKPVRFDVITARAFRELPKVADKLLACLKPGGSLLLYKGKKTNIEKEMGEVSSLYTPLHWEIIPLAVPFVEGERHLVRITG